MTLEGGKQRPIRLVVDILMQNRKGAAIKDAEAYVNKLIEQVGYVKAKYYMLQRYEIYVTVEYIY